MTDAVDIKLMLEEDLFVEFLASAFGLQCVDIMDQETKDDILYETQKTYLENQDNATIVQELEEVNLDIHEVWKKYQDRRKECQQ